MALSPRKSTQTSEPTAPMLVKVPQQYRLPVWARSSLSQRAKSSERAPPQIQAARPSRGRASRRVSGEGRPQRESMAEMGISTKTAAVCRR